MNHDVRPWRGATSIVTDIESLWPRWVEMAKAEGGSFQTPNALVATALLGYGVTTLLHSQVRSADIMRAVGGMFDLSTDKQVLEEIAALQGDREKILGFLAALLMAQGDWLRANPDGGPVPRPWWQRRLMISWR